MKNPTPENDKRFDARAEALRQNLLKRKQQTRARKEDDKKNKETE